MNFNKKEQAVQYINKLFAQPPTDPEVMYYVGELYYKGTSKVDKNEVMAMEWFRKAAELGQVDAQYALGVLSFDEYYPEAYHWIYKAAQQGHSEAQYFIFKEYCLGKTLRKKDTAAVQYLVNAEKNGSYDAALLYETFRRNKVSIERGVELLQNSSTLKNADLDMTNENPEREYAGLTEAQVQQTNMQYGMDKFSTPRGHGFAAERANHLYDILHGRDAVIVGDDNALNGADRIVDGQMIQTKFCNSGGKCVSECFDANGNFRYRMPNGQPMQIEVPYDMYDSAVQSMEHRIRNGQVPGVADPAEARNIIKQSPYTYEQVKNIAKAGTVESLTFDAVNGTIIATEAIGISALVTYATEIWNGKGSGEALENAVKVGLQTGGIALVISVINSQLARTSVAAMARPAASFMVSKMGTRAAANMVNFFRGAGQRSIYGAAAVNNATKILQNNMVIGTVTVIVLTAGDFINIFRGRISFGQLFKNVASTAGGVIGGWGGAEIGAAAGSAFGPVGMLVGGVVGGWLGGKTAHSAAKSLLDGLIEDDAKEMIRILEARFAQLAQNYLLAREEAGQVADRLQNRISADTIKDMYGSRNRYSYADYILEPVIEDIVSTRPRISAPDPELTLCVAADMITTAEVLSEPALTDITPDIIPMEKPVGGKSSSGCGIIIAVAILIAGVCGYMMFGSDKNESGSTTTAPVTSSVSSTAHEAESKKSVEENEAKQRMEELKRREEMKQKAEEEKDDRQRQREEMAGIRRKEEKNRKGEEVLTPEKAEAIRNIHESRKRAYPKSFLNRFESDPLLKPYKNSVTVHLTEKEVRDFEKLLTIATAGLGYGAYDISQYPLNSVIRFDDSNAQYPVKIGIVAAVYYKKGNPTVSQGAMYIDQDAIEQEMKRYTGLDVDLTSYFKRTASGYNQAGQVNIFRNYPDKLKEEADVELTELHESVSEKNKYVAIYRIKKNYGIATFETLPDNDRHFYFRSKRIIY
ncbi:MAG: SEL1-like repeat protein [Acidaminococcaceae bacterium]|nr:SEL1-like repeat protein [Acidaminococcaceae bacterium]